ncbi:hypothetical protein [Neptuniibacter sp. QD37_11]|uniref:hypothetical protein n=1 Tax=Neptuniibacter sp. QD37_11 TaxID=3398209 RepID=UPI0039F5711E
MSNLVSGFSSFTALSNRFHQFADTLRAKGYASVGGNKLLEAFAETEGLNSNALKAEFDKVAPKQADLSGLQTHFVNVAAAQGWNEATQLNVLMTFVTSGQSDFLAFLNESVASVASASDLPLNFHEAVAEVDVDCFDELSLYEVEIGVYGDDDLSTAMDSHMVVVASTDKESATQAALEVCEEAFPHYHDVALGPMNPAEEVSREDYL